jgi:hypothetical protein
MICLLSGENVSEYSVLRNYLRKFMQKGNNYAKLKKVLPNPSPGLGENDGKMFSTWNLGNSKLNDTITYLCPTQNVLAKSRVIDFNAEHASYPTN